MSFLKKMQSALGTGKPPAVTCPYCNATLDIEPDRKRKCPECGKTIHPKRLHNEEQKRFVTDEEAARTDAANEEHHRRKRVADLEQRLKDAQKSKNRYEEAVAHALIEAEAGNVDRAWGYYNQALKETMKGNQMGMYRCTKFDMSMLLKQEGRHKNAPVLLSEVCYLDYCEYHGLTTPVFAPGVLGEIRLAMKRSGTDMTAFRETFISMTQQVSAVKTRHPPIQAWQALETALRELDSRPKGAA